MHERSMAVDRHVAFCHINTPCEHVKSKKIVNRLTSKYTKRVTSPRKKTKQQQALYTGEPGCWGSYALRQPPSRVFPGRLIFADDATGVVPEALCP